MEICKLNGNELYYGNVSKFYTFEAIVLRILSDIDGKCNLNVLLKIKDRMRHRTIRVPIDSRIICDLFF